MLNYFSFWSPSLTQKWFKIKNFFKKSQKTWKIWTFNKNFKKWTKWSKIEKLWFLGDVLKIIKLINLNMYILILKNMPLYTRFQDKTWKVSKKSLAKIGDFWCFLMFFKNQNFNLIKYQKFDKVVKNWKVFKTSKIHIILIKIQ